MFQQRRGAHCAQTKRLGMCLFARANLTHRCLLKAPRFPYCLPLVQNSKCLLRPSSLLQHYIILQLGNKICLSRSYFPFFVDTPFLILLISAFFTLLSLLLWGFYRRDRQIMGVVSTLQLRAVIHTNFFHNHRHWQSPLILLITTILSSKPSSSERAHCTH